MVLFFLSAAPIKAVEVLKAQHHKLFRSQMNREKMFCLQMKVPVQLVHVNDLDPKILSSCMSNQSAVFLQFIISIEIGTFLRLSKFIINYVCLFDPE